MFALSQTNLLQKTSKINLKINKIKGLLSQTLQSINKPSPQSPTKHTTSPSKRRSDESTQEESMEDIHQNLKRGYLMLKHSDSSNKVTHKFVYISADNRSLCWKSVEKEDQKRIELISISRIVKDGAEYHLRANNIRNLTNCLVVISDSRKLQLEAGSQIQAVYLKYELDRALTFAKNMRLNYKYSKN